VLLVPVRVIDGLIVSSPKFELYTPIGVVWLTLYSVNEPAEILVETEVVTTTLKLPVGGLTKYQTSPSVQLVLVPATAVNLVSGKLLYVTEETVAAGDVA